MDDWHSSGPHPILRRTSCVQLVWLVFLALTHSLPQASADSPNLTSQVDQLLADPAIAVPVSPAHDAALARRLYLDLCGMRPTLDQISNYLSDSNPDRYPALVDRLIASPEFHEHWAERFDVMLMERRANTHVPQDQWTQWLRDQISADRPLHHWMADLIVADGYPADQRPAARFLLDRGADPHLITRDIGRIYFGRDLQCAQCHDHPSIDSYLQSDYHGLLGFVGSLGMVEVTEAEKKIQVIVEKSANEAAFESVFDRGKFRRVLPQVPFGDEAVKFVSIPGEDYLQPEVAGYPQRPAQSRRKQLAEFIRSGEQPEFNRNLANRLFGMLFGRSLIEPADLVHSENPPLHPELLDLLVDELRHSNFSLRTFLQQLVLSRSYRLGEAPIRYEQVAVEANEFLTTIQPPWFAATVETATATLPELERSLAMVSQQLETADHDYRTAQAAFEPIEAERLQALAAVDAARTTYSQSLDARNKATAERDAASSAVNAIHDKISKLQLASDAATGAIAAVGEDAEIAAAVAIAR